MRKILLSLAALLTAGVAWAQTVVTAINTEKYYTLECRSGAAHNTSRFIGDNGTVINGQSPTASYFVFEEADAENSYYIKSYKTGKYLKYVADGDKCIVSEIWRMRNVKGEEFRLLIRNGKTKSFSLYDSKDNLRLRTTSISKIK